MNPVWSDFGVLVAVYAVVLPLGTAPLLASERVRALLCWPTERRVVNYLLLWVVVVPLQMLGYAAAVLVEDRVAASLGLGDPGLYGFAVVNYLVPAVCLGAAVLALRRRDAMPTESYGVVPLVVLWYGAVALAAMVTYALLMAIGALTF
ncbi:hypothetical protein [Halosimplex pelagicum]|uniref:Uncharacterized protein n=1 Tax=Halosimplex pelagicum TaxID=869886 RepID=A0A7D5P3Z8_9EURY|nr:hypothetical protein [Halosimplex pelagicum]QLH80343.1 hypothetical protein HZS54_01290 [Halosimplex pelagicum]